MQMGGKKRDRRVAGPEKTSQNKIYSFSTLMSLVMRDSCMDSRGS